MYYVNEEQIKVRLATIPELAAAMQRIAAEWDGDVLQGLAQERALHQAIEIVTDVGSYLIDGFLMRDASSYEDIIAITGAEGVFSSDLAETLTELVRLRKPLVQEYYSWDRGRLHPLTEIMAERLPKFKDAVEAYLAQEL
ncbi:DUF86 domain-containing protein [Paenibacillus chungangensis]|uniref:DUF86 domain-containing protein n=1 Tax=Paenibacillus chungangensis TaxID=696535 RepID=A0ABW3HM23_9BACL